MSTTILEILNYEFIRNALLAGTCIAITAGLLGYFLIIRGLTFAGHALPNIGFAGAAGAVLLGIDPVFGLFAFTIGSGIIIALLGKEIRERDITIGILMAFTLGLGLLFLALYSGFAEQVYSILFGTILGISQQDIQITILACVVTLIVLLALCRPLLFSSFDPQVAEARGIPVQMLSVIFLILVAIAVSVSVEVVGALLVFTLMVGPAASATRITKRPLWALLLSALLGIGYTWSGILLAAWNGVWPVSFYIASISFAVYLPIRLLSPLWCTRNKQLITTQDGGSSVDNQDQVGKKELAKQA